jgi:GTP-binding protein EngB required for normal cell division
VWDSTGARYQAYRTHYQWKNGLVVKDWRYAVRIANVDVSDLIATTGTQAITAATQIFNVSEGEKAQKLRESAEAAQKSSEAVASSMDREIDSLRKSIKANEEAAEAARSAPAGIRRTRRGKCPATGSPPR